GPEVLDSAMYYNESDWLNIRAQVKANASLSKTLLGDGVTEETFPARMAALIKKKRQALAEHFFKERQNRQMTLAQQKAYIDFLRVQEDGGEATAGEIVTAGMDGVGASGDFGLLVEGSSNT
nr:hypothetical protein [Tanacetum cinerariifolium]